MSEESGQQQIPACAHIGTSGWSYAHWRERFYPGDLPGSEWLTYYARRFHSVEINSSFYRLPAVSTLQHWRDATPEGFVFAAKVSRYITHMKKLRSPQQTLPPFLERIRVLGDRLGPLLFQLPPRWGFDAGRLAGLLEQLGDDWRCAFEFRDLSWFNDHCYEILSRHGAALCRYELGGYTSPDVQTAEFVYVRLHGPAAAYQGSYSSKSLTGWAQACARWTVGGREVFLYFDNDEQAYAAHNAASLQAMIEESRHAGTQCRDRRAVQSSRRSAGT